MDERLIPIEKIFRSNEGLFPTPGPTRFDALAFLARHEACHLGQMGLLRRVVGLPAAEWPWP